MIAIGSVRTEPGHSYLFGSGPRADRSSVSSASITAELRRCGGPSSETGERRSWVSPTVFAVLAAASIFVNTRGAVSQETWRWRPFDRPPRATSSFLEPAWVWNWRYPQFMAGLLPADAAEPTSGGKPASEGPDGAPNPPTHPSG